jgi:hypothetical protein
MPDSDASGGLRALALRLAGWRPRTPAQPIRCRHCGATLGHVRAAARHGRVHLEGLDATVRVRWTAEDELSFEHVRADECEPR